MPGLMSAASANSAAQLVRPFVSLLHRVVRWIHVCKAVAEVLAIVGEIGVRQWIGSVCGEFVYVAVGADKNDSTEVSARALEATEKRLHHWRMWAGRTELIGQRVVAARDPSAGCRDRRIVSGAGIIAVILVGVHRHCLPDGVQIRGAGVNVSAMSTTSQTGKRIPINSEMIPMTTRSSIRLKPLCREPRIRAGYKRE